MNPSKNLHNNKYLLKSFIFCTVLPYTFSLLRLVTQITSFCHATFYCHRSVYGKVLFFSGLMKQNPDQMNFEKPD